MLRKVFNFEVSSALSETGAVGGGVEIEGGGCWDWAELKEGAGEC